MRAGRTSRHVAPALVINRMYHVYDIMGPPGRRIARHVRDSSIPLTVDGTARRVPGKGPGTGSGRVERRAAVLPGFVYFVSIHTVPPVPRGPVGKVYRDVPEAYQTLPKCIPKVQLAKTLQNSSESEACKDHAISMDHFRKFCAKKRAQIMYGPCKPHFLHWFAKSLRSVFLG